MRASSVALNYGEGVCGFYRLIDSIPGKRYNLLLDKRRATVFIAPAR